MEMRVLLIVVNVVIEVIQRRESRAVHGKYRKVVRSRLRRRQRLVWRVVVMSLWTMRHGMLQRGLNNNDGIDILVLV